MEKEINKDVDGKESSKRKFGMKLLNIGIYIAIIYIATGYVCSLIEKEFTYDFPLDIWLTFMGTGAGLLGITLVERFSKHKVGK